LKTEKTRKENYNANMEKAQPSSPHPSTLNPVSQIYFGALGSGCPARSS
jgi:hypothetical protein